MADLNDRWKRAWQKLQIETAPQAVFEELIQAYLANDRFYHDLTHIADCFSIFDRTKTLAVHPGEVELAIWFHDAIYDTRRDDNEQQSAAWAASVMDGLGLPDSLVERVAGAILATRHQSDVQEPDAQLMADVDLAIFGASTDVFWRYEENIRKEYAWVPEGQFRHRRTEVLRGFLDRPHLYYHRQYREAFERSARLHLQQAIARLSD